MGQSLQTLSLCSKLLLAPRLGTDSSQMQAWNHLPPHLPRCQWGVASPRLGGRSPARGRTACLVGLEACPPHRPGEDIPVLLCCLSPVDLGHRPGPPSPGLLVPARGILGRRGEIMPIRGPARPQLSQGGGLDGATSVVPLVRELPWGPGLTGVLSLSQDSGGAVGRSSFRRAGSR